MRIQTRFKCAFLIRHEKEIPVAIPIGLIILGKKLAFIKWFRFKTKIKWGSHIIWSSESVFWQFLKLVLKQAANRKSISTSLQARTRVKTLSELTIWTRWDIFELGYGRCLNQRRVVWMSCWIPVFQYQQHRQLNHAHYHFIQRIISWKIIYSNFNSLIY